MELKTWEEILNTECHPTLKAGILKAHEFIQRRWKYSETESVALLAHMLDFLGGGNTKLTYYLMTLTHAINCSRNTIPSMSDADEILRISIQTLLKKNADYGASVFSPGPLTPNLPPETAALVRLGDKYNRLKTLLDKEPEVNESRQDTVLDVIGYSIILMGMSAVEEQNQCGCAGCNTGRLLPADWRFVN